METEGFFIINEQGTKSTEVKPKANRRKNHKDKGCQTTGDPFLEEFIEVSRQILPGALQKTNLQPANSS